MASARGSSNRSSFRFSRWICSMVFSIFLKSSGEKLKGASKS